MDDTTPGGVDRPEHGSAGDAETKPGQGWTPGAPPSRPDPAVGRTLVVFVAIAIVILVAGLVVWVASGGADDDVPSATVGPSVTVRTSVAVTTTPSPTTASTIADTAAPTTTGSTATTTTRPTPTTAPPTFSLPDPGAETWTVRSDLLPETTLDLATTSGDIRVYDGVVDQLRCVGVVGPGDAVTTWCGPRDLATAFVADRGLEPLVIELGAEIGNVTIEPRTAGWTLGSNGCSDPMTTILAGVDPGALPITDVICRGDEAFLGIGTALFGPGIAPDGGGILAATGDEGWAVLDFGTSIDCANQPDGVDRCALFGVEVELFEALLPLPPTEVLGDTAVDVVGVTDRSADVEEWIGDVTDPGEIETIVVDQLVDPDAELPASTRRADRLQFGRLQLLVVEIPQPDDSIATETWAFWIGALEETSGVTAFSWSTCARGVTGDGRCV